VKHSITTSKTALCLAKLTGLAQARGTLSLRRTPSRLGEGATRGQRALRGLA